MHNIIHLSDVHSDIKALRQIIRHALVTMQKPLFLVTGDVVDSARREEFETMDALVRDEDIADNILMVPGNHDTHMHGNWLREGAHDNFMWILGKSWDSYRNGVFSSDRDNLKVVGIDTSDPKNDVTWARGGVNSTQVEFARDILDNANNQIRIVMMHHHPFRGTYWHALDGAEYLMNNLKGRCEYLLFGHDHHLGMWESNTLPMRTIASHKVTEPVGDCLLYGILDADLNTYSLHAIGHRDNKKRRF